MITHALSSGIQVSRGSSTPHASWRMPGPDSRSGVSSTSQFEKPFCDRATVRWLIPRRSSTRHSSTVAPSTSAAPAFSTALMAYGHRSGVSSGLPR